MSYRIALADVEALSKGAREAGTEWARGAQDVNARVGALCATSSFAGSAADAVRARLTEADSVVALALGQLAQEIAMRATVYADAWHRIDSDASAYLPDGEMTALAGAAHAGFTNFDGLALEVGSAVSSVSDLVGTSAPSSQTVLSDYEALWAEAERTRDDAGALEARQAGELATATALADALDDFLSRCEGTAPGSFTAGSLSATPELASLAAAYQASGAATLGLEAAYESASARERALAEHRAAEERERSGWWQLAGGVFAAAVGVGAIVLSGGAAIPVVLGVGAAIYGAAEMDEARQNISLGSAGDATTSTWNFLRDGAMGGNQTAYDVFGFVTTSGAGAFALGGTALRGAIQGVSGAQRLKFTADVAIKALTADAMGTAAGAGASEVSRRLGLSDGQARFAGTLASIVVGAGTQRFLDSGVVEDLARGLSDGFSTGAVAPGTTGASTLLDARPAGNAGGDRLSAGGASKIALSGSMAPRPLPDGSQVITDGSHWLVKGESLQADVWYRTGENGYLYHTDEMSRIDFGYADELRSKPAGRPRLKNQRNTPDKVMYMDVKGQLRSSDDAGHIFGDLFGGSPMLDNLLSQNWQLNQGVTGRWTYKSLEKKWAEALSAGKKVEDVRISITYEGASRRPAAYYIDYTIDGEPYQTMFRNTVAPPRPVGRSSH